MGPLCCPVTLFPVNGGRSQRSSSPVFSHEQVVVSGGCERFLARWRDGPWTASFVCARESCSDAFKSFRCSIAFPIRLPIEVMQEVCQFQNQVTAGEKRAIQRQRLPAWRRIGACGSRELLWNQPRTALAGDRMQARRIFTISHPLYSIDENTMIMTLLTNAIWLSFMAMFFMLCLASTRGYKSELKETDERMRNLMSDD